MTSPVSISRSGALATIFINSPPVNALSQAVRQWRQAGRLMTQLPEERGA